MYMYIYDVRLKFVVGEFNFYIVFKKVYLWFYIHESDVIKDAVHKNFYL